MQKAIKLQSSLRQGDVISLKLFTTAMENAFKLLNWNGLGINIKGDVDVDIINSPPIC